MKQLGVSLFSLDEDVSDLFSLDIHVQQVHVQEEKKHTSCIVVDYEIFVVT